MRTLSISAILLSAVSLSACVSATSTPSFQQIEGEYIPFANAVLTIAEKGPTAPGNIGNAGPNYSGIVYASTEFVGSPVCDTCSFGDSEPLVEYLADLYLVADFSDQTLSGNLSNFFTPLAGFKNPNGTISLVGTFTKNGNSGDIDFSGSGTLTGSGMTASYEIYNVYGGFGGTNGQIMVGGFLSEFDWLTGTYAGSTSESDGLWVTAQN